MIVKATRHPFKKLKMYRLFLVSAICSMLAGISPAAGRPNIIVILMDDMGYNDAGAMTYPAPPGQYPVSGPAPSPGATDPDIPAPNVARFMTPHIDSLASSGLSMTRFHSTLLCSPTRSSLMTGRYCRRVGVNGVFFPSGVGGQIKGLNTREVTLPEILREQGYATGMVGKWHLGYVPTAPDPFQMMPTRHGFHEYYGHPHSNDMDSFSLIRNETILDADFSPAAKQAEITWRYTEEALDFIQRKSGGDKPFFLYLAQIMSHIPCWPSDREFTNADGTVWPRFRGSSGVSQYYDVIKEIDHGIGRILNKLGELGIDDNTLVIFTSDNGPWIGYNNSNPNLSDKSIGSAYPLHNGKSTTWEGGVRVPFFARWKGKIAPGTVINQQVGAVTDLLPTLVGLSGGSLPAGRTIDGIDLWPQWSGQSGAVPRVFAHFRSGSVEAIVKDRWKLRANKLYDLWNADDQETTDHAAAQPAIVADLEAEQAAITASINAESTPLGDFTSYQVIPSVTDLLVLEGASAGFNVSLSADPGKTVTVSVVRFSGDPDLGVSSGASLVFNTSNWSVPQAVTLTAAGDADRMSSGATFHITTDDITHVREVFVLEQDDDVAPAIETTLVWPKVDPVLIAGADVKLIAHGSARLDGQPAPAGTTYSWVKVSGPGTVTFTDPTAAETGVEFGGEGIYQLRLTASHPDAAGSGSVQFTVNVGAVGTGGGLKHSPPLAYDASRDLDGDQVWKNLVAPGTGDVTLDSGVQPNTNGIPTQTAIADFDPTGEFDAQFTGGAYADTAGSGLDGSNAMALANGSVTSFSGTQSVSLPAGGFATGTAVTLGAYFKLSAFGSSTGVAGQTVRLGLTNGGSGNFTNLPFSTIELTNTTTGAAKFVYRETNHGLPVIGTFDLDLQTWYYFETTFTRTAAGSIDLSMSVYPASPDGSLGTLLASGSSSGVAGGLGSAAMDLAIHGAFKGHQAFANGATGALDGFSVKTLLPPGPIDPAPGLSFIGSALDFPGGTPPSGGISTSLDTYSTGNASFLFWFKPDTLPTAAPQVLWETGGDVGTSFILDGGSLKFVVDDGTSNAVRGATATAALPSNPAQDGFIHATGIIDLTNDEIRLYLDGSLASTQAIATVADWCGSSGTGFGKINTPGGVNEFQQLGGNDQLAPPIGSFAGKMAMARFYDRALSAAQVAELHANPLAIQAVGNLAPQVTSGPDLSMAFTAPANLVGMVGDDGQPAGSSISTLWQYVDGPALPVFADARQTSTNATFSLPGIYQLRLAADDGEIKVFDESIITVAPLAYAEWAAGIAFPPGQDTANANPDQDKFTNLWEWALGYDPLISAPGETGIIFSMESIGPIRRLILEFDVPRNREPDIRFQSSGNLHDWQILPNPNLLITPVSDTHSKWILHHDRPDTTPCEFLRMILTE